MADLAPFPVIESILFEVLADLGTVDVATPADLSSSLPFVRVKRFGGSDDRITDTATVDVDCFAGTWAAMNTLAEQVRQRLINYPHTVPGVGTIDTVTTLTAPNEVPWSESQSVRRSTASYQITARR